MVAAKRLKSPVELASNEDAAMNFIRRGKPSPSSDAENASTDNWKHSGELPVPHGDLAGDVFFAACVFSICLGLGGLVFLMWLFS